MYCYIFFFSCTKETDCDINELLEILTKFKLAADKYSSDLKSNQLLL